MVKYEQSKIYRLVCNTTGLQYVGSTTEKYLTSRKSKHYDDYKQYKRGTKRFITSFKVMENENFNILLLENYPCKNVEELRVRERYWIEKSECVNKQVPSRTKGEWMKQYQQDNKEKWNKYQREYRQRQKKNI